MENAGRSGGSGSGDAAPEVAQVLVIDDDFQMRAMLAATLQARGYTVALAEHGKMALDYLERNAAPRLILLDLVMPRMEGFELRARLLRHPRFSTIPVAITSGMPPDPQGRDLFHAVAYLCKPFDWPRLLSVVAEYCGPATG